MFKKDFSFSDLFDMYWTFLLRNCILILKYCHLPEPSSRSGLPLMLTGVCGGKNYLAVLLFSAQLHISLSSNLGVAIRLPLCAPVYLKRGSLAYY